MIEFDELKRAAESATPGGWAVAEQKYPHRYMGHHIERMIVTAYDDGQLKSPYPIVTTATGVGIGDKPIYFCHISEENAAYIAAANPATILALIARVESTESLAERLERALDRALTAEKALAEAKAELARLGNQQVMGRVHNDENQGQAWLNSIGRLLPDNTPLYAEPKPPTHPGATHCDNCGCTWLDDGLNPLGCPYCKKSRS